MLTLEHILDIFRSIVIAFPYHKERRLNTFGYVDRVSDLNAENLQKNYEQFDAGYFWSREWVNSGAERSTIKTDYDLLFVENKQMTVLNLYKTPVPVTYKIFITIASPVKCDDCKERTWEQIDRDNRIMMVMVLQELFKFQLYEITIGSGEDAEVIVKWMTPTQADAYDALEDVTVTDGCMLLKNLIAEPSDNVLIYTSNFGVDALRTQTVELNFKACITPETNFNYIVWPPVVV